MPAAEKGYVIENVLHIRDQVCRDDNGGLGVIVADDGAENVVARRGIDTADRLVEQIEFCLAAHDEDELYFFACALGHLLDLLLGLDAEPLHHLHGRVTVKIIVEIAEKRQQLQRCHPVGEICALRQIGNDLLRLPQPASIDVVPHEGTWIEIGKGKGRSNKDLVVSHEGTWIEIC